MPLGIPTFLPMEGRRPLPKPKPEVSYVEIAQKLQNLEISLSLSNFLKDL